jgi:hypothetical protein
MKTLFLVVGITMALVSVRYFLDAQSHLAAAVAGAGLAIASALCFVAAAVVRLADDAPDVAPQRTRPAVQKSASGEL